MIKIYNFINQTGAGPKKISLDFLNNYNFKSNKTWFIAPYFFKEYINNDTGRIIFIPISKFSFINFSLKIILEIVISILCILLPIKYTTFGNFSFVFFSKKQIVLIHHPYLLFKEEIARLPFRNQIFEKIKVLVFKIFTCRQNIIKVVQAKYLVSKIKKDYNLKNHKLLFIPNPLNPIFNKKHLRKYDHNMKNSLRLCYVSKFYLHKNHNFLLSFSSYLKKNNIKHIIYITIEADTKESIKFLKTISDNRSIVNIGNINLLKVNELMNNCHYCIYPSLAETFGNNLLECIALKLPVIAFKLPYIESFFNTNEYIKINEFDNNLLDKELLKKLITKGFYEKIVNIISKKNNITLSINEWIQKYEKI